jgi:tetratricopeptide (TPR) repeat protein
LIFALGVAEAKQQKTRRAKVPPQAKKPAAPAKEAGLPATEFAEAQPPIYTEAIRANNIGIALMEKREFTEALGNFQRACILNPESDTGCLNVGIALFNMGRYDDAATMLRKSAERDPQNPRPWFNLGLLERESGRLDEAQQYFEKVAGLDPDDPGTQYFLGYLAEEAQQYEKAAAYFQNAIDRDPSSVSAEYGLAQAEEQMGDADGAKARMARYQELSASRLAERTQFIYGEQGRYSLAQEMELPALHAQAAIPIHFLDVSAISGLPHGAAALSALPGVKAVHPSLSKTNPTLAEFLGSGACVFDYDGDGKPDVFLVNADGKGNAALYRNLGRGRFVNVTKAAKIAFHGQGTGCAVGDYDNDGHQDLAIGSSSGVALLHNEGDGRFSDATNEAGVRTNGLVLGLTFFDYDGDGKLDLYAARFSDFPLDHAEQPFLFPRDSQAAGNVLWHNEGNGTFKDVTQELNAAGSGPSIGALATDVNNDRATDLVVTGWQKFPALLLNSRDGAFRPANPWAISMPGPAAGGVAIDLAHSGWMDLAFTHWAPPGMSVWRNVNGKSFQRVPLVGPDWMRGWGIAAIDYDNDGWMDLAAVGETFSSEGRIALFRNEGSAGFRDVTHETRLDKISLRHPRSVIAFDFDGDGATDLLVTQNDGPPVLLKSVGGNRNNWLELGLAGDGDNRMGIAARVRICAGAQRQGLQVSGASGYLGQGPAVAAVGLGMEGAADVVRIVWPSGTAQDEMRVVGGKRMIKEAAKP